MCIKQMEDFYAGLNADCLRKYDAACVFHCINQDIITTNCANKFE